MEAGKLNMLGMKRRSLSACPDRPQSKITKDDTFSIYESTLLKLRDGSGLVFSSSSDMSKLAAAKMKGQESTIGDASFQNCGSASTVTASCTNKSNLIESSCSCLTESQKSSCSACRRVICDRCFRLCEHCHSHFCSYCTIYNFNNQFDRVYCLGCNLQEETRKH